MKTNKEMVLSQADKKILIAGLKKCVKILGKMRVGCIEIQKELGELKKDLSNA